jgi:chloramphenicol-sensitive protein RarD
MLERPATSATMEQSRSARWGVAYGLAAYAMWGVFPLYFHVIFARGVLPLEVLAHRVAWSCVLLLSIVTLQGRWPQLKVALKNRKVVLTLLISTILIATNWLTFLYAVSTQQVLQASLGYFLTPLANVVLGVSVLGERLRVLQLASVALAVVAVGILVYLGGELPWIALVLAITFALYGLCRKTVAVDSMLGLTIETGLLAPLAFLYLGGQYVAGQGTATTPMVWLLLILSGGATALPLLLFASAARRLRFVTIGFLQYVGPSIQFLVAVLILREPFTFDRVATFALIWIAVALYSADSVGAMYGRKTQVEPAESSQ